MAQDETPKKRKGGRPKGVDSSLLNKKRRQYSYGLMERIRERIDPDVLIDFHVAILEGKNPVLESYGETWRVIPDPNPMSPAPTLEQKSQSAKWLTDRGHGLPVQSTQVDVEIRARIDQMGSGVSSQQLQGSISPHVLKQLAGLLKAPTYPDAIDAEFVDHKTENPTPVGNTSEGLEENNPLPVNDSGDSDNQ